MFKIFFASSVLLISSYVQAGLTNGGFESFPVVGYGFYSGSGDPTTGWATTAPDNTLEIWSDGFLGVPAYEGSYFAELNANYASTLYQEVNGLGDFNSINWHFAHRGRDGVDTMRLTITDLGADQVYGNGDDVTIVQQEYSAGNTAWVFNSGTIISIGNKTRFAFEAVSAVGGTTQGNLIDDCDFGLDVVIPSPGMLSLILIAGLCGVSGRKRKS
jgi:hypothetical protein